MPGQQGLSVSVIPATLAGNPAPAPMRTPSTDHRDSTGGSKAQWENKKATLMIEDWLSISQAKTIKNNEW